MGLPDLHVQPRRAGADRRGTRLDAGLQADPQRRPLPAQAPASAAIIGKLATDSPVFSVGWFPGYDQWIAAVKPLLLSAMRGEIAVDDALRLATAQGDAALQQFGK